MKLEELPLLDIFNSLRQRHGLPLGVDEYLAVLRSLQAGFGIGSRQEVEQLCCLVWAKSEEENRLVRRLFEQMWRYSLTELGNEGKHSIDATETLAPLPTLRESEVPSTEMPTPSPTSAESEVPSTEMPTPSPTLRESEVPSTEMSAPKISVADQQLPQLETHPNLTLEPVQAVQAVRSSQQHWELKRPRYSLLTEYFPVTRRQMKQCWRYLRRPAREGVPIELNVEATVAKMECEGILLEPVLMPPRSNRTDLVLMIDQEGSMVPFHQLSRQLVETAERGGQLRQTRVFYFHDYPDEYLYRHPALLDAQPISEVLEEIGERAAVLIISDAGAARGNFDQKRVESTKVWIEQLQQSVRYCAWLNPMPNECWQHTTAGEIARFLPMFEMSRQGMNAAISILRGRYIAWETMYSWLL